MRAVLGQVGEGRRKSRGLPRFLPNAGVGLARIVPTSFPLQPMCPMTFRRQRRLCTFSQLIMSSEFDNPMLCSHTTAPACITGQAPQCNVADLPLTAFEQLARHPLPNLLTTRLPDGRRNNGDNLPLLPPLEHHSATQTTHAEIKR